MAHLDAVDRKRPEKLYHQLIEIFRSHIEKDIWKVGMQIPTEDDLVNTYNISKATVRLAIEELVLLGYLKKFQGKGTFVRRKKPDHTIPLLTNLAENGICNNPACISRLIEYSLVKPDHPVRQLLHLGNDHHCHYVTKLTITAGTPFVLQKIYLPYHVIPVAFTSSDQDLSGTMPLYVLFETRSGLKIHRMREMVDLTPVRQRDAELLELPTDSTVLRARQICSVHGGSPVMYCELLYHADAYARTVDYERLNI